MKTTPIITVTAESVTLSSPYNADLAPAAKRIGGRWDSTERMWRFAAQDEARVRDLAREIYGTDGSPADLEDLVTVHLPLTKELTEDASVSVAGREVVGRRSRHDEVRLGADVVVVAGGEWTSPGGGGYSGSVKYPKIGDTWGTVLEVRGVPRAAAERDPRVTIVEDGDRHRAVLVAERGRLVTRLAEIEAQLEEPAAGN